MVQKTSEILIKRERNSQVGLRENACVMVEAKWKLRLTRLPELRLQDTELRTPCRLNTRQR